MTFFHLQMINIFIFICNRQVKEVFVQPKVMHLARLYNEIILVSGRSPPNAVNVGGDVGGGDDSIGGENNAEGGERGATYGCI